MDRQWNSDEELVLQQEIEEIEATLEEKQRVEDKLAAKLWQKIEYPLSLTNALSQLTKNDLSSIRSALNIRNASSLNKQALVQLLSSEIPRRLEVTLGRLDEPRYAVLKRIANAGGQAFVSLGLYEYEYFKLRGLAFTGTVDGNRTLVMPQEILEAFNRLDVPDVHSALRKQTEWLQISQGLLYYYGFLPTGDLIRMVENYIGAVQDQAHYLNVLFDAITYGYAIDFSSGGFMTEDVLDEKRVIREQQSRPDVPFYPFTKAQLLRAGKQGFSDRNSAHKALVDFLRRSYEIDLAEAEEQVDLCVYQIQNGDALGDVIAAVTEEFEVPTMDILQTLTRLVGELHNNTRQWFIKGHTPRELFQADRVALRPLPGATRAGKGEVINIATKKKVGRNDPCPCGSGQKYKKCCGR